MSSDKAVSNTFSMERLLRDSIIWLGCILLLLIGMILGVNINSDSDTLDSIYKVFGSISGIATLAMASIAAFALSTWKTQFYHEKIYDHLTELETIARNTISHLEAYITANNELRLDDTSEDLIANQHYKDLKKSSYSNFLSEIEKYRIHVGHIFPLLTEHQVKDFKYTFLKFSQDVHALRSSAYQLYVINEFDQAESNKIESEILNLKLDIKDCFQRYWRR
ncbi:hypothetical protein [Pseudoalteromonas sp. BSi20495]|uniref:hypothetical protein n=1 Tax=Pseudoalteromonas sp. BSi20495 TaxID=386429 RepID=UPI0011107772|nr:hypothetical protein [Pseudoalteromonas sp. BSi20495]